MVTLWSEEARGFQIWTWLLTSFVDFSILVSLLWASVSWSVKSGYENNSYLVVNQSCEMFEWMNQRNNENSPGHSWIKNMEHYSPFRKKSTGTCQIDKNIAGKRGRLKEKTWVPSRSVACHCTLHRVKSRDPATHPCKYSGWGWIKNDQDLKEIISKWPLFPLWLSLLILSCPLRWRLLEFQMCTRHRQGREWGTEKGPMKIIFS